MGLILVNLDAQSILLFDAGLGVAGVIGLIGGGFLFILGAT